MKNTFASIPLLSLFALTACSVPVITPHLPETPVRWSAPQGAKIHEAQNLKQWWRGFHDENLTWLIEQTLKESPDIRLAAAKIAEARGLQTASFAAQLPLLTTGAADLSRNRTLLFVPLTKNTGDLTFDASYEVDLFGKNREAARAASLNTQALQQDFAWISLSMAAEVARNYIALRAAEKKISLAEKNLKIQQDTLSLVKRQYKAGAISEFDVARTTMQVNQSSARITDFKRQGDVAKLALVTLTGLTTSQINAHLKPVEEIPGIDLAAVVKTPASVLAERPDIAAANLRFSQATSVKKSQAAAIFPTISLSGIYGISQTVYVPQNYVWSLTANTAVNILDFGRIQGHIAATSAREVQAYESWRKTLLQAIQDVETALTHVIRVQEQRVNLQLAKQNAAKAVKLAQVRYYQGDQSLLDVLDSERQLIESDSALIDAEGQYATSMIALYKSLGQY